MINTRIPFGEGHIEFDCDLIATIDDLARAVEPIRIWPFAEAPEEYRTLSRHGGDEDWLAYVPRSFENRYMPFLEEPVFGYSVSHYYLQNGDMLVIGAHA